MLIIALARNCSDLRELKLQCPMTDVGLEAIGQGCPLLHSLELKESRVGDAGIRALSGLCTFKLDKNSLVTMAGITELIRHSPNLRLLRTHRCRHLIGCRDQISDLMDSNRNKQLGLAEVITTIP